MGYAKAMIRTSAYFGRDMKGVGQVSQLAFDLFARKYIDPEFECYTVKKATGVWHGTKEATFILEVIMLGKDQYLVGHKMAAISEAYKTEFYQEAVFVTRERVDGWLI